MAHPALKAMACVIPAALVLGGCDRLAEQWPFHRAPSSVTVKLPPPKTATPGFAFNDPRKAAPTEIH